MKNYFKKLFILPLFLLLAPVFAQTYSTGAILDPALYERTDAKPVFLSRSYASVPRSVSLRQYGPVPENQGKYGTCAGWATAFAARTISESIALNRTDQGQNSSNVFSPIFVYKGHYSIRGVNPTGQEGAVISYVLDYIRSEGAVKRPGFETTTTFPLILLSAYANSKRYPISGYARLFSNPFGTPGTIDERVAPVKKSLADNKPVVIGMNTPPSFHRHGTDVWRPHENPNAKHGGHAMCVIGYDDNKYGGAFEVQNSWGTDWGDKGYIWIPYNDFARFVCEAYEMIENPALYKDAARYAASIVIEVGDDGNGMPVTFDRQGFYKTISSYPSGTVFRYIMTNRYPAYVYAFAADSNTADTSRIFPLPGVSPVLDYIDSSIAWPGEEDWIALDDVVGTDYLVVLYSKEALDIDAISQRFSRERGAFPERVARSVGSNFIPYKDVQYNNGKIEFTAVSVNPKSVFGLLLAIDHRAK
jgi:hypothetical protein